jgi:hypothetical protein
MMRASEMFLDNGKMMLKSTIPASDMHCFFGDNSASDKTLDQWAQTIQKGISSEALTKQFALIEKRTGMSTKIHVMSLN